MTSNLGFSAGTRFLIAAAAFIIVVAGLKTANQMIVPFLLSAFIATICAPALFWLQHRGVPTWLGVTLLFIAIMIISLLMIAFVGSSLNDFSENLPLYQERLREETTSLTQWLNGMGIEISAEVLREHFDPGKIMGMVGNILSSIGGLLTNTFLIILTVIFILFEASSLPAKIRYAFKLSHDADCQLNRIVHGVLRYLELKTIISIMTGLTITIILSIIGVDYPVLWGIVAFMLNYVPNIGSILAAIPAVLLSFIQLGLGPSVLVIITYVATNTVFGNVVEPRFMGKGLGLSTLVVFLSLIFWGWILGPVGMLLSVPLTMILKIILENNPGTEFIAILLGPDIQEEDLQDGPEETTEANEVAK